MNCIRKRRQGLRQVEVNSRNIKTVFVRRQVKSGLFWNWTILMFFYLLISVILYTMVTEFGLLVALVLAAISYPYAVLAIGTILLMRGDITERGFIALVLEGFKAISQFKKIRGDSAGAKPAGSPSSKKS